MNQLFNLASRSSRTDAVAPRTASWNPLRSYERRGLWVVLLGPDGAGKSAVIAELVGGQSTGFRGCEAFHLRPIFLRRGPARGANVDPHGQAARGTLITMFKLVYLLIANWVGYLVAVRPKIARGNLILFDRYFPDCLVDPRRYRLPTSCRRMAELIARLIPKPDMYVVLDASADTLQERKREVTLAESLRQRTGYERQIEMLPNMTLVDASRPLRDVAADVLDHIIELHLARYRQTYKVA